MDRWKNKAVVLYAGTQWEKKSFAAGKAMDDKLDTMASGPYGSYAPSGSFDMFNYLAYFDYEILVRRNLQHKIILSL